MASHLLLKALLIELVPDLRDQLTAGRDGLRIDHAANQRDLHTAHTKVKWDYRY